MPMRRTDVTYIRAFSQKMGSERVTATLWKLQTASLTGVCVSIAAITQLVTALEKLDDDRIGSPAHVRRALARGLMAQSRDQC